MFIQPLLHTLMFAGELLRGLYYRKELVVSKITSGLTLSFQSYDGGLLLARVNRILCWAATCSRAGCVGYKGSTGVKQPLTDLSDQFPCKTESHLRKHPAEPRAQTVSGSLRTARVFVWKIYNRLISLPVLSADTGLSLIYWCRCTYSPTCADIFPRSLNLLLLHETVFWSWKKCLD